jgi:hypothetical protein
MPAVAIAFNGDAALHAFDNEIDAVSVVCWISDADLRSDMEAPIRN